MKIIIFCIAILNLNFMNVKYAIKNDIEFNIIEPQKTKIIKKNYADNFLKK